MTVGIKDGVHLGRRVLGEGRRRTRLTRSQNIEKMTDYREGRHASGETCETAGTHGRRRWCRDYARAIGALEGYGSIYAPSGIPVLYVSRYRRHGKINGNFHFRNSMEISGNFQGPKSISVVVMETARCTPPLPTE